MQKSRFFVANLPKDTKENDLRMLFADYGEVDHIEIKTKENVVAPDKVKIIAFVTLKIEKDAAEYCVNELNWVKLNGGQINVSLAKESFLERLKRERAEAEALKSVTTKDCLPASSSDLLTKKTENKRTKFSEDVDLNDDDISPELLIKKKRAATSIHNGKIIIQSYDTAPLHIIEHKKVEKKLDGKSTAADQKRKESLKKLKVEYEQKKIAIQNSLARANVSTAKKIKFSDAESGDEHETKTRVSTEQTNLFDSDDEEEDNIDLDLKCELFGKKAEQLMALQSKQSLDPRFKIDAKFVDDDDDEVNENSKDHKPSDIGNDERNWQMGLLEQVVGTKLDHETNQNKISKKKMLRYDPAKDEHRKFERKTNLTDTKQSNSETLKTEMDFKNKTAEPLVSKEIFYIVKDTLAESLKARSEGFSLLTMFENSAKELVQREDQLKKVSNEKILINKIENNEVNPFKYDSSSESENEYKAEDFINFSTINKKENNEGKVKVVIESFFIPKNDVRLKEGAKFFTYEKDEEDNYDLVRDHLKKLIKTKIVKSKKNIVASRRKGKNKKLSNL